jgi:fructokinase
VPERPAASFLPGKKTEAQVFWAVSTTPSPDIFQIFLLKYGGKTINLILCALAQSTETRGTFMYDVIALGELLIDFTVHGTSPQGNPLMEANPGGAPCNVLAMLAKLGRRTAFVGKVGQDLFGAQLRDTIQALGIDSRGLLMDPQAHTTLAFVRNTPDGDREFSFYRDPGADELLRVDELPAELLRQTRIFHFGSLSLTREPAKTATRSAVETARGAGALISFDPNLRPSLWRDLDRARAEMRWGCSVCDILKVTDGELAFIADRAGADAGVAWLRETFPNLRLVLVTHGNRGSTALWQGERADCPACLLPGTVDTTGAGDTFCGCCLHYVIDRGLENWDRAALTEMLRFANAAAGLLTTRRGALRSMPAEEEIRRLFADV